MKMMKSDQSTYEEGKLISLLQENSEYAFQLIYDKHRNRIYKTAIKFLKSPIIAQDVVQDVFLKLWFERKAINASMPLEAWLFTVAKNNILNKLRKIANEWKAIDQLTHKSTFTENTTEEMVGAAEFKRNLALAILALPEQQKSVFRLSKFENLTYFQIGQQLGISPLTVKTHLSRAIHSIKRQFESKGIQFVLLAFIAI